MKWLHVGVFSGEDEDVHNGYAFQTDHNGIKVSFLAVDPESGVVKITLKVGTSPGIVILITVKAFKIWPP